MKPSIPASAFFILVFLSVLPVRNANSQQVGKNLAVVASASSSVRYGVALTSLNDGLIPRGGALRAGGGRSQQRSATQWIQYEWPQPVVTNGIAVFWWNYENSLKLPHA